MTKDQVVSQKKKHGWRNGLMDHLQMLSVIYTQKSKNLAGGATVQGLEKKIRAGELIIYRLPTA
jgi:hypothetical protein